MPVSTCRERPTPARWKRIEEVFVDALELDVHEREQFVASACEDDAALQAEVLALLANMPGAAQFVDDIVASGMNLFDEPLPERRVGPYRLIALVGEGGMGTVYLAERDDAEFRRQVAIKVLRVTSPEMIARFRDERQILADLDHHGIVRLIDGGTSEGMPYLVMEKIDGVPITQYADQHSLSIRERVALIHTTCTALAYAHDRHVVHRDIKPSNLLVTSDGTPKLVDFGIAKLLDDRTREARTKTGAAFLTPEYASPEQVRGDAITPATDIYSLGTVLYELLAGRPPHQGGGALALMRAIGEEEPRAPSEIGDRDIPRAIDRIVLKTLRKRPEERYPSVAALEADLSRFLDGRPVSAGPPSWIRRARRVSARSRIAIVGVVAIGVTVLALRRERTASVAPRDMVKLTSQLGVLSAARFGTGDTVIYSAAWGGAGSSIYAARPGEPPRELMRDAELLAVASTGDLATRMHVKMAGMGPEALRTGRLVRTDEHGNAPRELAQDVIAADWTPSGELAITRWIPGVSTNGTGSRGLVEWPIGTIVYETKNTYLDALRVSPDGQRIAFLEGDTVKQLIVIDRDKRVTRIGTPHDTEGLAWHGSELWVADTIDQRDRCVYEVTLVGTRRLVQCSTGMLAVHDVARDGRVLVTSARMDARIVLETAGSGEREVQVHSNDRLYDVTPDGRWLLFGPGGFDGPLYVRDVERMDTKVTIGSGRGTAISPDGAWVAVTRLEGAAIRHFLISTWGGREIERIAEPAVQYQPPLLGGWAPDSKRLYTACLLHDQTPATCAFDLDGRGTIVVRGKRPGASQNMRSISPDGRWILGTDGHSPLELIATDGSTARALPDTRATRSLGHDGFDTAVGWSADSRSLFVATGDHGSRLAIEQLDVATGESRPWRTLGPTERSGTIEFTGVVVFGDDGHAYSYVRTLSDLYLIIGAR